MRTSHSIRSEEAPTPAFTALAAVREVDGPGHVVVALGAPAVLRGATVAVAGPYTPAEGDRVLVVADGEGGLYVVGVIGVDASRAEVRARDGARARLVTDGAREAIEVVDGAGRLLFEHDAASGRAVIHAAAGDLELRADAGSIRLSAARSVEIDARERVRLGVLDGDAPSIEADARSIRIESPALHATTACAELTTDEARVVGRRLESTFASSLHAVGTLEVRAERVVERAREIYTEVAELAQTHAGRIRVVARETFHLFGKRTLLRAEKDMKLNAAKIHLA